MIPIKKIAAMTAIAVVLPLSASAIPIEADMPYTVAGILPVGGSVEFSFDVTEDLDIADFSLSATDTNGGADIQVATFDYNMTVGDQFDTIFSSSGTFGDPNATGVGSAFVPGWGGYSAGDIITFTFNDGIQDNISLGLSFQTTSPAAIPVPAAGFLLGSVLLGAGFAARRRKS